VFAGLLYLGVFTCAANEEVIPLLSIQGANWTSEEFDYIKALNRKGSIKIATKVSSTVYSPQKNGSTTGFHYNVLKEFADLAKIKLDIQMVTWNDYFYKKGEDLEKVKTNPSYSYAPTLIDNVDLYLDGFTVLPWREKMFDIVKYVPSRQMLISRIDNIPKQISALNNKVFAVVKHSSMEQALEKIKSTKHIGFTYINPNSFDDLDKMVSEGKADFTVYDSDRALVALEKYKNLTIAWPIGELEITGWAINKKNKVFKGILDKYIKYAQENAILDKYWKQAYGVTFVEYLKVLNLGVAKN
jgi:membrane-bound lytic murein transglycosylase MltF